MQDVVAVVVVAATFAFLAVIGPLFWEPVVVGALGVSWMVWELWLGRLVGRCREQRRRSV